MNFVENTGKYFELLSETLFSSLLEGEDLTLNLIAENSLFLRFNANRIRQNTNVEQLNISLQFQSNGRSVEKGRTASGNKERDQKAFLELLASCRDEAKLLPPDPNQVPLLNNGNSTEKFQGRIPALEEILDSVEQSTAGQDLAGLFASGPVIRANRNSKGQSHWFSNETFFFDYSLYNGPKAAKGVYAGADWSEETWRKNIDRTKTQLDLLSKKAVKVNPGKYRTYFAPAAFGDLASMMNWKALSAAAWKQGQSPFKKLADGELKLSPLLNVKENFSLGLSPRFNELGEMAPAALPLIEKGELKELLVSSRTAKEFGLKSNSANSYESPRALDISCGSLSEQNALKELGTGLYLSNLHYLNWSDPLSARVTGMTRYACFWVEKGEIAGPIQDLRWDESLYEAFGAKLIQLTSHSEIDPFTDTYFCRSLGGRRGPGALIDQFSFTL